MVSLRVLALALAAALQLGMACAENSQPTPAVLLAERAFAIPVDTEQLVMGRATAATGGQITIHSADGAAHAFQLAGITLPTGRRCLHPDNGMPVDCGDLVRQTLASLLAGRDVGCLAAASQPGECYLAYGGAWYSVNRLLVRSGMVKALAPRFIEAERRSRIEGAGLWDPVVYPTGDGWRETYSTRPMRSGAATKP